MFRRDLESGDEHIPFLAISAEAARGSNALEGLRGVLSWPLQVAHQQRINLSENLIAQDVPTVGQGQTMAR